MQKHKRTGRTASGDARASSGIVLQIDRDGKTVFINEPGRALFGCGDECIGDAVFGSLFDSPRDTVMSFPVLRAFFNGEHRHPLKNGREIWISWSGRGVRDWTGRETGILCTGVDVTEFRKSEDVMLHAAEEWRATFDSISDILFVTDRDSRILRANLACAELLKMKPGDLVGRSCSEVFPPGFLPSHESFTKKAFERGAGSQHEFSDQARKRHYEITLTPVLGESCEPVKVVNVIKDITERKQAEEILRRLVIEKTAALQGTQRELENARRLSDIGVLAATIAHEIRNPLAAIKTAAYNVRRKSRNPDLESHLANIDKKVMESDQIIRNLLNFSRIKLPNYEWVPVAGILNESVDALTEKYSRLKISITRDIEPVSGTLIEADPVHLKVLFNNILDNACQALNDGAGSVHVAARSDAGKLSVTISDTGVGINADDLKRISEPFFTTKSRGIGLGLTICYQIANLHHGSVRVESEKGKGTTVSVVLPLSHSPS